jgi:tetratricopeptide (TPR) repeat protein
VRFFRSGSEGIGRIVGLVLAASAFALGVTKIEDWDAWTHLALGREMVHLRGFPATEPFSFPSAALPYYNTEWLFAVVLYLAYALAGVAGVILLKAALGSLAVFILWKDSGLGREASVDRALDVAIRAAVLFPGLLLISYRFVERPDLVLMVFLSLTIYALNAYLYEGRRYLYALPVMQVLWANMHPSAVLAIVPFAAFLGGGLLLRLAQRRWGWECPGPPSDRQLKTVGVVFGATLLASLVNPYGTHVLWAPLKLASPWLMQNVLELQPPAFAAFPAPTILTGLLVLTSFALARRVPIVMSSLLVVPFVYLGFSAVRFVFLLVIVAAPVLARHLSAMAGMLDQGWAGRAGRAGVGLASSAVLIGVAAVGLTVAHVEPFVDPTKAPGIGIHDRFLPERALRYLEGAGISGRVFNTFHWGGYLVWRAFPRYAPIIDGRGYLPPGLREAIHFANSEPWLLERLQRTYGFDVILVAYPGMLTDARQWPDRAISPEWALVYWDDVAAVFLRRSDHLADIITRDEYRYVNPASGVPHLRQALTDLATFRGIQIEVYRNVAETGSSLGYTLLGFLHLQEREYDKAIEAFRRVEGYSSTWHAMQGLALAYWQKGDLSRAIGYYKGLAAVSADPIFLYNVGLALAQTGNDREAVDYLEQARARDGTFLPVYPALTEAYHRLGQTHRDQELQRAYAAAVARVQVREHLRQANQFNREGKAEAAIAETKAALQLEPRNARALGDLGEIYFRRGLLDDALTQQRAALEIDPHFAEAHYRLALIHQRRAQYAAARKHFEEYVRLEPRSYLAWRARQELSALPR